MAHPNQCTVCDAAISPYAGATRCADCSEPCGTCGGDVAQCHHPLKAKPSGSIARWYLDEQDQRSKELAA